MKEINGKIKFGVISIFNDKIFGKDGVVDIEINIDDNKYECYSLLSEITEEQAAEFVDSYTVSKARRNGLTQYGSYRMSNKESLISLLKANDVWIKEWSSEPKRITTNALSEKNKDRVLKIRERLYSNLPDDLLIIKL